MKPIRVNGNYYNCGYCRNCRINKVSAWTVRLLYELDKWDTASFVTLTYNDDNLPSDNSLCPEHLKQFHESLRYRLRDSGRKFKYYSVGEYGDSNHRPHYHCILFGLNPNPYDINNDRQLIADSWKRCDDFIWKWKNRHNAIDYVNRRDISYVTGYFQKKLTGNLAVDEYGDKVRPFQRSSTKLGLDYLFAHADNIKSLGYLTLNGKKIAIPRYFREKLEINQSECVSSVDSDTVRKDTNYLYREFMSYLEKKGRKTDNPIILENEFIRWYENREWDLSTVVERQFQQKRKIQGDKI